MYFNEFKYKVTDFFYAGSAKVESAWFGFVAVTTDEGKTSLGRSDILVAWRGTITDTKWINNANLFLQPAWELFGTDNNAEVHSGFLSLYSGTKPNSANNMTSARQQVILDTVFATKKPNHLRLFIIELRKKICFPNKQNML